MYANANILESFAMLSKAYNQAKDFESIEFAQ